LFIYITARQMIEEATGTSYIGRNRMCFPFYTDYIIIVIRRQDMKNSSGLNCFITILGVGVTLGALGSVIKVPLIFVLAVGLGIMQGGVLRAIAQIERKLAKSDATGNISQ